jgi:hypothetical protein
MLALFSRIKNLADQGATDWLPPKHPQARARGGTMGKEITYITSVDPSNLWPHLAKYYSQENPN